jgi:hypothetical protein
MSEGIEPRRFEDEDGDEVDNDEDDEDADEDDMITND